MKPLLGFYSSLVQVYMYWDMETCSGPCFQVGLQRSRAGECQGRRHALWWWYFLVRRTQISLLLQPLKPWNWETTELLLGLDRRCRLLYFLEIFNQTPSIYGWLDLSWPDLVPLTISLIAHFQFFFCYYEIIFNFRGSYKLIHSKTGYWMDSEGLLKSKGLANWLRIMSF